MYNGAVIAIPNAMKPRNIKVMLIPALCTSFMHHAVELYGLTQPFSASSHCTAAASELQSCLATVVPGLARARVEQGCLHVVEFQSGFMPCFQEGCRKKSHLTC